jgi:hypothetical protein
MPRILAQAMLYGRQTDRPARLELQGLTTREVVAAKSLVQEVGGESLEPQVEEQVVGQTSDSHQMLAHRWYPPRGITRQQLDELAAQFQRTTLLERWPDLPLGVLGGRSARDAATDPAQRARVLAAIMVVEHWCEKTPRALDFNELRTRLGLPVLDAIDVAPGEVASLSLVRLSRVSPEKLSDDDLLMAFQRAILYRAWGAVRKISRALVSRPSFANRPERFQAYSMLAQSAENFDEAMANIEEGRRAGEAAGRSCASWDLLELSFRFSRGEGNEAMRLVGHIEQRHIKEPGVAQTLTQMLVDIGLLRPDGTPAHRPDAAAPAVTQAVPAAEPGRLWTPGSESAGGGGGGGKLWTPD